MVNTKIITNKCMKTNKNVQILLSTYNGENYLREQLNSYIAMEGYENIKVLIRDDGSTDGTKNILEEYKEVHGFEVIYGKNLGVNHSVKILIENCDMNCEYFAISDQDDVWLTHKISLSLEHMQNTDVNKPTVFASRTMLASERLNPLKEIPIIKYGVSFFNAMVQNVLPGHTQVLNRELLNILRKNDLTNVLVIDWWIYMVASAIGEVTVSNQITVLHRQHGKNAVGYEANIFKHYLLRAKRILAGDSYKLTQQLQTFYKQYESLISKEKEEEIRKFIYCQKNIFSRLRYVFCSKIYRQTKFETFAMKILYVLGNYKN